MKRYFDKIFHYKEAQNLVAEHYVRDFYMIFQFKEAQIFAAEHYEIDFWYCFGNYVYLFYFIFLS